MPDQTYRRPSLFFPVEEPLRLEFGEIVKVAGDVDPYTGDYEVFPTWQDQSLPTKDKFMADDVTIHEIPHSYVDNEAGGLTLNIGG